MGKKQDVKQTVTAIRKSSRLPIIDKKKRVKEAEDFLADVSSMQEKLERENIKMIAGKSDLAVKSLNDSAFLNQMYNVIWQDSAGVFSTKVTNFLAFLNWEGKSTGAPFPGIIDPPQNTLGIRKPFDDFNDILKKDQTIKGYASTIVTNTSNICKLTKSKDSDIESYRKEKRDLQKFYQHMCFYCGRQIKVKNPTGKFPELLNTQCDHIFPITSALLCLKRDSNILYNFHSVHRSCNSKATSMNIDKIWNEIGTPVFTSLNPTLPWCNFNFNGVSSSTNTNTQEWCRGYLSQLLNKLTIVDQQEQTIRKEIFERILVSYTRYKEEVRLLLENDVAEAVSYLALLSSAGTTSFGKAENNIKLVSIQKLSNDDKKYETTFLVNGKVKRQKFGASGMSDYTIHKDTERRNRYINRHYKDLDTKDPTRAGYLSMFILWDKPSLRASIKQYKTRLSIYNKTGKFPVGIKGYSRNNFGVNQVAQLARYKPVTLPDDILRKLDKEYLLPPKKIAWKVKEYLPKKRIASYTIAGLENSDPGESPFEYSPLDSRTSDYLEKLATYNTKVSILAQKEYLREIYRNLIDFIGVPIFGEEEKLNYFVTKRNFILIMGKLGITISFKNFNRDIQSTRISNFFAEGNNFGTPQNVVNKKLYEKIKATIHDEIKGRKWGAYDSGRLVQIYKARGGKYLGSKTDTPLERWYKEKWINACKWPQKVPCGRKDSSNKMAYCRPSVKVTKDTPVLIQSLTQEQIDKRCKRKHANPLVRII